MTYDESIDFLYGLRMFGLKLGLDNTRRLAGLAGNPQDRLRFLHIAGTNGKGSVAAMLDSIYRQAGLRVGLYTSPHLVSFRERIQVDRRMIPEAEVVRRVEALRTHVSDPGSDHGRDGFHPTFFEFTTVLALQSFAEHRCDVVIWETGLGGRLDATNIVNPLASVITNIEPDHQRWLGEDPRSIAAEKAGIIKPGIPVITGTSQPEALAVIEETAQSNQSPLTLVPPAHTTHPPLDRIGLPLLGWHQRMNAAVALATVGVLQSQIPVPEAAIVRGLETVRWPGRLQRITGADGRRLLLDGAHNAAGATALRAVLEDEFADLRTTLILGVLEDKDWDLMCEILAPVAARILCVPVRSERGAPPEQLAEACRKTHNAVEVSVAGSVAEALDQSRQAPLTVVAGSLHLVGEALTILETAGPAPKDEARLNDWTWP